MIRSYRISLASQTTPLSPLRGFRNRGCIHSRGSRRLAIDSRHFVAVEVDPGKWPGATNRWAEGWNRCAVGPAPPDSAIIALMSGGA
jgi:hypothetical protein